MIAPVKALGRRLGGSSRGLGLVALLGLLTCVAARAAVPMASSPSR